MPCVKESTTNAISEVGDDNLRIGGIGEEVLALQPDGTYPEAEYMDILRFLASNEWSFEHHATAGTTQHSMLDMWDEVNQEFPITDLGWRMLHPGDGPAEPNDETLAHLKELGAGIIPTDTLAKGDRSEAARLLGLERTVVGRPALAVFDGALYLDPRSRPARARPARTAPGAAPGRAARSRPFRSE